MLPFTPEQFRFVFVDYNHSIWPAQIAAYLLGGVAVALLFRKRPEGDRVIAGNLAMMWLWTGVGYHLLSFSSINKAAYIFAVLFIFHGCYLLYVGVYRCQIDFGLRPGLPAVIGGAFVAYAAIIYPVIGVAAGHAYPEMPMFGVTPCPMVIFTFGLLLLTVRPVPRWLLVVPFIWSLIGGSAAILLQVPQDWLLLVSGVITVPLLVLRDRQTMKEGIA
ncbi:DUF6064 family protein [Bradyrhizobium sp.]|uniref:DUF6064 family protein n=1 Tax=Bradyrhizobium sp. TaxID=376 RepID=UPI002735713C|nr:DUF6064 family protein [Bradyrhizobium sp.]MDP3074905.1 DUF6064 family protein [Bradyrhizobium sp.]